VVVLVAAGFSLREAQAQAEACGYRTMASQQFAVEFVEAECTPCVTQNAHNDFAVRLPNRKSGNLAT
jgi:hypothetical protein